MIHDCFTFISGTAVGLSIEHVFALESSFQVFRLSSVVVVVLVLLWWGERRVQRSLPSEQALAEDEHHGHARLGWERRKFQLLARLEVLS